MQFNQLQLAAMVKAGKTMALADGKIEENELLVITSGLKKFGVSKRDFDAILELSEIVNPTDMLSILSKMGNEQKKYVCGYLAAIMASDGDVDDSEVKLWCFISQLAGFPEMTLAEAGAFWVNC
jgi:uncharacterized membrane protein YebE (DUF533 family)